MLVLFTLVSLIFAEYTDCNNDRALNPYDNCESCLDEKSVVKGGSCVSPQSIMDGCLEFEDEEFKKCSKCTNYYYLNEDKVCVKGNIQYCYKYFYDYDLKQGNCTACEYSTYPKDNECIKCGGDDCLECDPETRTCKLCHGIIENGECKKGKTSLEGCKDEYAYGYYRDCVECDDNYFWDYADCSDFYGECYGDFYYHRCFKKVDHCTRYNRIHYCTGCEEGYYLNYDNECIENTIDHCSEQKNEYECKYCESGYWKNITFDNYYNHSINICIENTIDHCSEQIDEDTCSECEEGYFMNRFGFCIKNDINHCIRQTIDRCYECEEGYFIDSFDKCSKNNIDKCKIQADETHCDECEDKYYVNDDGLCLETTIPHCEKARTNETCNFYKDDYVFESYCEDGYVITSEYKQCLKTSDEFCVMLNESSTSECLRCKNQYVCEDYYNDLLKDKDEIDEDEIDIDKALFGCDRYYPIDGKCKKFPEACLEFDEKGYCIYCYTGYAVNSQGECTKCVDEDALSCSPDGLHSYKCKINNFDEGDKDTIDATGSYIYLLNNTECYHIKSSGKSAIILLFVALLFILF